MGRVVCETPRERPLLLPDPCPLADVIAICGIGPATVPLPAAPLVGSAGAFSARRPAILSTAMALWYLPLEVAARNAATRSTGMLVRLAANFAEQVSSVR